MCPKSVISALVKDAEGDHSDPTNYRGLTLGVVNSQLFEHAPFLKIGCSFFFSVQFSKIAAASVGCTLIFFRKSV